MSPKISIIIPCYNQAFIIEETLESVYKQVFSDWECIIIDDGSTDRSKEICNRWCEKDARFKYFYKKNGGLSSARNYGIEKSLGKYIQFLDSDDLIGIEKLKLDIEAFNKDEKVDLIYSAPLFFYENNNGLKIYFDKYPKGYLATKSFFNNEGIDTILENNFTVVSSPLVKKAIINEVGGFNTSLKSNEDWEFWARLFFKGTNIYYRSTDSEDSKTLIRVLKNSMSTNFKTMLSSELEVRRMFDDYIEKFGSDKKNKLVYINSKHSFRLNLYSKKKNIANDLVALSKLSDNKLASSKFIFSSILKYIKFMIFNKGK